MATFADTLNPSPAAKAPEPTPVASPEELQARVSGWEAFLNRLQTDPVMQRAALHTATQLAQGPGYGQSELGHLAQSLEGGVQAYDMGRANQRAELAAAEKATFAQALQTEQEKRAQALQPSVIRSNEAQAAWNEARAADAPAEAKRAERKSLADLAASQRSARNPALEAKMVWEDSYKASSEGRQRAGEKPEDYKARVADAWLKQGQKGSVGAIVQAANAILNNPDSTPEDITAAQQALTQALKGQTGGQGAGKPEEGVSKSGKPMVKINGQWVYK